MSVAETHPPRRGFLAGTFGALRSLILGTLLSMTPVTSILVLGWLVRRMRFVAFGRAGLVTDRPGWVMGARTGLPARWLGGLAGNIRSGLGSAVSVALATFPFAVLWSLSWWAGWENSFGKGYEQSWVGPTLGMTGVAVFCVTMIWLPMALAHQAVEERAMALFDWRRVRSAVRASGWGYVALAFATVFLALPLFASRGLIVFASDLVPGFDAMTADEIATLAGTVALIKAGYAFAVLVFLRGWAARIYAVAVSRARNGPDAALWSASPLAAGQPVGRRSWSLTHWVRLTILPVIWFGLVVQIFVGQFLNHDWLVWLNHPLILLPFAI